MTEATPMAMAQLSRWKCHKEVWAEKIAEVRPVYGELVLENARFAPIQVGNEFIERHKPQVGGYYVVYDDGYKSYSPAGPFESGYTLIK